MKYYLFLLICSFCLQKSYAQKYLGADNLTFEESEKNVQLIPLASDTNSSSYLIQVKEKVAAHYHAWHTESIYVTKGEAEMQLGDTTLFIKAGDFVHIPPKTVHSVKVTSSIPLEVVSVQAPQFFGKDRIYIQKD